MKACFRLLWSRLLGRLVVVPACIGNRQRVRRLGLPVATSLVALFAAPALAQSMLPSGADVVSGSASISSDGAVMTVNQSSQHLIANWQDFSIGSDNGVVFNQPNADALALNRVVGQNPTQILGNLSANGRIFLINPNGIVIGTSGQVQTGGFVASTLGLSDDDFLSGDYDFSGGQGQVVNKGEITAPVVALIAPSVGNDGVIRGDAALAAVTGVSLDFDGDGLLSIHVDDSTLATVVENNGLIQAGGGVAILTAKGASDVLRGVVNNTGMIEANTLASKNGRILLLGDMDHGQVAAGGQLKANFIETSAAEVSFDPTLAVDTMGGEWLIDPVDIVIDGTRQVS